MKRIYEPAAYAPQAGCWWADTVAPITLPQMDGPLDTDVAIVGAGFTGLMAAYKLAQSGARVTVLEAESAGFGASGRNGGFCCLGGAMAEGAQIKRAVGAEGLAEWRRTEMAAIETVRTFLTEEALEADTHSQGETCLAHSARAWRGFESWAKEVEQDYGIAPELLSQDKLRQAGMNGPFHGALTIPIGFALNPRKYHSGLLHAAIREGARVCTDRPVQSIKRDTRFCLETPQGSVTADQVIIATNGYSSEDLPDWMRSRYIPVQSSVLVTRPLSESEQSAQGWTSDQMAYDSRMLLHYFRKLPDGRFLFGMRGGLKATASADRAIFAKLERDFRQMFPAWAQVEITHKWQGLVCLTRAMHPFCGPVPDHPGLFAGFGYHGNGVAMGSHTGTMLADLILGYKPNPVPALMQRLPQRFPLGRWRRHLLQPAYTLAGLQDG